MRSSYLASFCLFSNYLAVARHTGSVTLFVLWLRLSRTGIIVPPPEVLRSYIFLFCPLFFGGSLLSFEKKKASSGIGKATVQIVHELLGANPYYREPFRREVGCIIRFAESSYVLRIR